MSRTALDRLLDRARRPAVRSARSTTIAPAAPAALPWPPDPGPGGVHQPSRTRTPEATRSDPGGAPAPVHEATALPVGRPDAGRDDGGSPPSGPPAAAEVSAVSALRGSAAQDAATPPATAITPLVATDGTGPDGTGPTAPVTAPAPPAHRQASQEGRPIGARFGEIGRSADERPESIDSPGVFRRAPVAPQPSVTAPAVDRRGDTRRPEPVIELRRRSDRFPPEASPEPGPGMPDHGPVGPAERATAVPTPAPTVRIETIQILTPPTLAPTPDPFASLADRRAGRSRHRSTG